MTRALVLLVLLVACSAPATPAVSVHTQPTGRIDAGVIDVMGHGADAMKLDSTEIGPLFDSAPRAGAPQDHELTFTTASERITIRDSAPNHVEVAPLDNPAGPVASADGTWAVARDPKHGTLVAGALHDGKLVKPVVIHRGSALIRFLGALEQQRTVVLELNIVGVFLVRSQDAGKTWTETKLDPADASIATSRDFHDVITNDRRWIRVDRHGDVTTTPIDHVAADPFTCASKVLWVPFGGRIHWFADGRHGYVEQRARGPLACAGDAVLVPVDGGFVRCVQGGCGTVQPGQLADLMSDGIVTATQSETIVRIERTGRAAVDVQLDDREQLVGVIAPNDTPVLVLFGATKHLRLATVP